MAIKRKTEIYKILIKQKQGDKHSDSYELFELEKKIILKDFLDYYHTKENNGKVTLNSKDICYYIDYIDKKEDLTKVRLKYIKFNRNTNVVNVDTLEFRYKKDKKEGDEERQHYIIKTYDNTNRAVLIYEKMIGAVTISMMESNINKYYKKWIKSRYENEPDERNELLSYEIKIEIVPSPDFIEELLSMDKINLLKITVDKEKITSDEDIIFSEDHISRKDIDLVYKPIKGLSFSKKKVINYFKNYQDGKTKINRILISGRKQGNGISLDTEQMKLSKYIETELDIDGLVKSENIFEKYEKLVNESFKDYFNNVFIDLGESED
jgi:hypothetical protein